MIDEAAFMRMFRDMPDTDTNREAVWRMCLDYLREYAKAHGTEAALAIGREALERAGLDPNMLVFEKEKLS